MNVHYSVAILRGQGLQNIYGAYCEWEYQSEISAQFLRTIWYHSPWLSIILWDWNFRVSVLFCFCFFFSPRGRARFSNDFWKAVMLKNKQVKTEGLHLTLWELIQNASTALLFFFFNLSSHTSAQTDNNVCIITARETGRVMQIRERHLHTLSIKFFFPGT